MENPRVELRVYPWLYLPESPPPAAGGKGATVTPAKETEEIELESWKHKFRVVGLGL